MILVLSFSWAMYKETGRRNMRRRRKSISVESFFLFPRYLTSLNIEQRCHYLSTKYMERNICLIIVSKLVSNGYDLKRSI